MLVNKYFPYHIQEELIDYILLYCGKTRVLWQLLFSLFKVSWVLPSSVKDILLGWHGSLVEMK